ncbi:MAG: hypothetical protein HC895_17675 [Leptolyngbyaceae cyanobacterium SM1_3_5]|nr:hypothetical protein [Leptolyngbyaceae cyanobacterium SM1_3_5]
MMKAWVRIAVVIALTMGFAPAAIAQIYERGDRGDDINRIQLRLGMRNIDGIFGAETENAVQDFQRRRGLRVDGVVGPDTLRELGLSDLIVDGNNPPGSTSGAYVVVVPGNTTVLLNRVRRFQPAAALARSGRGSYIRAGAFAQRSIAERVSRQLRDNGLDARVAYRPTTTAR